MSLGRERVPWEKMVNLISNYIPFRLLQIVFLLDYYSSLLQGVRLLQGNIL